MASAIYETVILLQDFHDNVSKNEAKNISIGKRQKTARCLFDLGIIMKENMNRVMSLWFIAAIKCQAYR